jgi:hypothetical protein
MCYVGVNIFYMTDLKLIMYVLVVQNEMMSCNPVRIREHRGITQSS